MKHPDMDIVATDRFGYQGLWAIKEFDPSQCKRHATMSDQDILKDYRKGHFACCKSRVAFWKNQPVPFMKKNAVVEGLINTIVRRMVGTNVATQDLLGRKLAIGYGNATPAYSQIQLAQEKYRFDFTDQFQDGQKAIFVTYLTRDQGNGEESQVIADAGNSTTQIRLTAGHGSKFLAGQRIRVTTTSQFNFANIISVVDDVLTLDPSEPLVEAPLVGGQVIHSWAEAAIFGNADAGAVTNTGTMFNRVNGIDFVKDDSKIILIEVQFIFTPV